MTADRMVKLATLWQRKSAKGATYFSGFLGDVQVLMFRAGEITRPNGEIVQTWRLMIQERDPDRRPQSRELSTRGQSTWDASRDIDLPTGATVEHRNQRRDPRQEHVDELARRFDERPPDDSNEMFREDEP